jgi:hypothetical protein
MSEFAAMNTARTPRMPTKLGLVLIAAALSACTSTESGPSHATTTVSTASEAPSSAGASPTPHCDDLPEPTPTYVIATPFHEDLIGKNGPAELWHSWVFLQQMVEEDLSRKHTPEDSTVKVSATVGPMITKDEEAAADEVVKNAIGGENSAPTGELKDSTLYDFVRDPEHETPDPSAPLGTLVIKFQPVDLPDYCSPDL